MYLSLRLRPWPRNHDNHFKEQIMNKYPVCLRHITVTRVS